MSEQSDYNENTSGKDGSIDSHVENSTHSDGNKQTGSENGSAGDKYYIPPIAKLLPIEMGLLFLVVAAILGSIVLAVGVGQNPIQWLADLGGLSALFFATLGTGIAVGGVTVGTYRKRTLTDYRTQLKKLEPQVNNLAETTEIGTEPDSIKGTLDQLIDAAERGTLSTVSASQEPEPDYQENVNTTDSTQEITINEVVEGMLSQRLPKDTAAKDVIDEIRDFDPHNPGSLKQAIEEMKYLSEDIRLIRDLLAVNEEDLAVSSDPNTAEFKRSINALNEIHEKLNTSVPADRPPTIVRVQTKKFVRSYMDTVSHFQSHYDRTTTEDKAINLHAAQNIEADPAVNLPTGSTSERLIENLQTGEDDMALQQTLEEVISELNAYHTVEGALDSEEQLQADIHSFRESVTDLHGPVIDVLSQKTDAVEQLLSRTSVSQMDEAQRITIQERINVLQDIAADLHRSGQYDRGKIDQRLSELDASIESFISRYIDNRDWSHFNHGIPNHYLRLTEEFQDLAIEAASYEDERARAYIEAAERTLALTEELYQKPKFTSLLDPTVD